MESYRTGFPPFPLLLEIPSGFPHSHRFDDGIAISKQLQYSRSVRARTPQGACNGSLRPQRNVCPGTLALSDVWCPYSCASAHLKFRAGVAGSNRHAEIGAKDTRRLSARRKLPPDSILCPERIQIACALADIVSPLMSRLEKTFRDPRNSRSPESVLSAIGPPHA
jgi:hypothetical protein